MKRHTVGYSPTLYFMFLEFLQNWKVVVRRSKFLKIWAGLTRVPAHLSHPFLLAMAAMENPREKVRGGFMSPQKPPEILSTRPSRRLSGAQPSPLS